MNIKRLVVLCVTAALVATSAFAQVHVRGYTRKDGTYVAPHYRSAPNSTKNDNYSTRGNVNPYTGEAGTKPRDGEEAAPATPAPQAKATPAAQTSATAQCRDGSLSYSQHRSGTCSGHGGVSVWY